MRQLLSFVARPLDLLVPPVCASCGLPGQGLCDACRDRLVVPPEPLCSRCGHPTEFSVPSCAECPPKVSWARQAVLYRGPAPLLVTALKDRRRRALAAVIADLMADGIPLPGGAILVPVPLSPRRQAERGFNQSLLIARDLAARCDGRVVDALQRVRPAPPQRGASASDRTRQVAAAFRARPNVPVPRDVIIVDDVHTTGATLAACARALRRAGAQDVGAVCFARAPAR
jgi:ComF family protein